MATPFLLCSALLAALALPSPTPVVPMQTPPPEPNHVTVDVQQSVLKTSGYDWENAHGYATTASLRYEFQTSPKLRFANTVAWQRLSSVYTIPELPAQPWWFNYVQYRDEFDVELGRPDYPTGVGIGYYDYTPVNDFGNVYNLRGLGIGIDRWANYYTFVSPYYSLWYYPDVRGGQVTAGAYTIVRADVGINWRPSLVRPWNFRAGLTSDTWFTKSAYSTDSAFNGFYAGITYWR